MGTLPGTKLYVMNMMKYIPWKGDSHKIVNLWAAVVLDKSFLSGRHDLLVPLGALEPKLSDHGPPFWTIK